MNKLLTESQHSRLMFAFTLLDELADEISEETVLPHDIDEVVGLSGFLLKGVHDLPFIKNS